MEEIELVINIPEEIRLALINNIQLSMDQQSICNSYIKHAIITGTPLPRGHGDLIDRKELEEKIWEEDCRCGYIQVVDFDDILDANIVIPEDKESEE